MKFLRTFLLAALFVALALPLQASNLLYGPWVHNVDEHGFTVLWVTEKPSLDYVELAPDDDTAFEGKARPRYYETSHGRRVIGRYHSVRIDGLQPGTVYRYRLAGKVLTDDSHTHRFVYGVERQITPKKGEMRAKTLDASADSCRFSMFNDIHFDDARFAALAAPVDANNTDFIVLNGDIVSNAQQIDTLIRHSIMPIAAMAGRLPLFYVRGNHEGRGHDFDKVYAQFPTPTGEFWYSFRQGPAAFIVLDAGEDKHDNHCEYSGTAEYDAYRLRETAWLEEAVKDPAFVSAPCKICLLHIPTLKNKGAWYTERWIAEHWVPVLEKAGIDVMLSAHFHYWLCSEAGQDGKGYPVLVNSNKERMDVTASAQGIEVKTYDVDGTLCHQWKYEK